MPIQQNHNQRLKVALVDREPINVLPEKIGRTLAENGIYFLVQECKTSEELVRVAADADVIWIWGSRLITEANLPALPHCGVILRTGSGTDNVPLDAATRLGITVINTPRACAEEVSDHAIGLLFAVIRRIAVQDRAMRAGEWKAHIDKQRWHLRGSTLGLVGFGHIAQLVARKLCGFQLRILAHDPFIDTQVMEAAGVTPVGWEELFSQSDFLSVHCPLTPGNRHLIGKREFGLMKTHAVLINTSRGPVVDEAALIEALRQQRIGAAGLDVFEQEPTPADNPLLRMDNVVVTPHIAGYSDIFHDNFFQHSVDALVMLAQGQWPASIVNREVKARWSPSNGLGHTTA
jgi:D-3-phosphoglycerate dehydrogenase